MISLPDSETKIYTVSQLNRETRLLLGRHFLTLQVAGEISNLSMPSSGHIYFTLKDAKAQIRCAMFRSSQRRSGFKVENGAQIIVTAQVSLYETRGDYQLIVEQIEAAGAGELRKAYEQLKRQLSEAGLFDNAHKQALPELPVCIGVISSPTGAAVKDILAVLKRRFPAIPVIIYPTAVQGENAKYEIVQALATANQHNACSVLLLARGGGSIEDLWAFNEVIVARAIFASKLPVVTGIGHDIDNTIADYVADLCAATPSAAAEHLTPDAQEWSRDLQKLAARLTQLLQTRLSQSGKHLQWLSKSLQQQHPDKQLQVQAQHLDELELRIRRAIKQQLQTLHNQMHTQSARLWQFNPATKITAYQDQRHYLTQRLYAAIQHHLTRQQQYLAGIAQTLDAISPLATLNRGYAIVSKPADNSIITASSQLKPGEVVKTRLARGQFISKIEEIYET